MRPMSEEVPALTGRTRLVVGIGVGVVIAAGLLLRFWARSGLWLDEALTVDIARLPLGQIPNALKHDGAPPLYYYLLHFWIVLFGQSDDAVRSLSGVIAVITLPVGWLCGKRLGGRAVAWTTLVLLASAPFAVYYATESRMYALVILLTGCGFLALGRAVDRPRPGNLIAVAVVAAALLYTQYWAIYLVAMVGIWLVVAVIRTRRHGHPEDAPWAALIAVAAGGVLFLPWVPTFVYQAKYTGTPWAAPAELLGGDQRPHGLHGQSGLHVADGHEPGAPAGRDLFRHAGARHLRHRPVRADRSSSTCAPAHAPAASASWCWARCSPPSPGGSSPPSAFSSRYAAVVFLPFLLLVALGTTTLLNPRVRVVIVGLAVVAGLVSSAQNVTTQRTQGPAVAAAINAQAKPGDVIAFCPDQLGPSVYREIRDPSQYDMVTFPRRTGPQIVNWVNYADTVHAADPNAFATYVGQLAGANRHVWLVWEPMYQTYGIKCETIATDLLETATKNGGGGRNVVTGHPTLYYEPMNLTEFSAAGS